MHRNRSTKYQSKPEKDYSLDLFQLWSDLFGFKTCLDCSQSQSCYFEPKNQTGLDFKALTILDSSRYMSKSYSYSSDSYLLR